MTLEAKLPYFNPSTNKTIIPVQDIEQSCFVRFDAEIDGNQTHLEPAEILERAMSWFINRYVNEYAGQKLDERVRQVNSKLIEMDKSLEENQKARAKIEEDSALNTLSRHALLQVVMSLYKKGVLNDEELAGTGLFDDELSEEA